MRFGDLNWFVQCYKYSIKITIENDRITTTIYYFSYYFSLLNLL